MLKWETDGRLITHKRHLNFIVKLLQLVIKMSALVFEIVFATRDTAEMTLHGYMLTFAATLKL
jgi:hypothetical protein